MSNDSIDYQKALEISRKFFLIKKNIKVEKGANFKYVRYRVLRPLLKFYYYTFKYFNRNTPWTSPGSILIFNKLLNKNMTGFEYGSGKSTIYFAKRINHLVSVEHEENWYNMVSARISDENLQHVQYHLIARNEETEVSEEPEFQRHYATELQDFQYRKSYYAYFQFILNFPDDHFNFVLVDGRARVECALNSIPKIKPGGCLIVDNSERERYAPLFAILGDWKQVHTTTGLTDTLFFFKPFS